MQQGYRIVSIEAADIYRHEQENDEVIYGFKCYNQLNNGSKDIRIEAGIDDSKTCNLREICDWKLEMMARHNDMKKLVWEFTIVYKEARSYRKEKDGMLRPNQCQDLTVRMFI